MSLENLFWLTGLILWSLVLLALVVALVWYLFSSLCTIIFVYRIARELNFKNKNEEPIPLKDYVKEFRYWQHCTDQTYHVTITKTCKKVWMPWPYGGKKYRDRIEARERAEWEAEDSYFAGRRERTMVHQNNRRIFIDAIQDLHKVPMHLLKKWWNENYILKSEDAYCWPAGLPYSLPIEVLHRMYKEFTFWTVEPVGLYNPENLGKIDPHEQSRDH